MKERTTMERRVYYFERQIELGWLPFFFFFSANTAAATVSNLDKNTSSAAAEAVSSVCRLWHQIQMAANYFGNVPYCES